MPTPKFDDKLLARLDRLDPDQVQSYLAHVLGQRQLFQTIFNHLDEGVIVTDSELRMLFINRRARTMLGWGRARKSDLGEDLGRRLASDHPLRDTIDSLRGRVRAIESYECPWGRRQQNTLSLSTLPMRIPGVAEGVDEDEELILIVLSDVTERRRRQSETARAKQLASLATLTSGIAHEIKNPLNSLNIHAQLLRDEIRRALQTGSDPEGGKVERASLVILEETERLGRIVEDFLQAARPRSPLLEVGDLRPLIERTERVFGPECDRYGIALTVNIDPELPPVRFDEHLFSQALHNLAHNAIEALRARIETGEADGGELPHIDIEAALAGDVVNLTVGDNGPGIAPEALEHIFEPYFTTKDEGTGLGLMVVYRTVTEHGGSIHVDSEPGKGTRFVISLPLHQKPVRLLESQEEQDQPPPHSNNPEGI